MSGTILGITLLFNIKKCIITNYHIQRMVTKYL